MTKTRDLEKYRDDKGRWKPGNPGAGLGGGRKAQINIQDRFYRLAQQAITDDDWLEIVDVAKAQAKNGSVSAREWLAKYVVGSGTQDEQQGPALRWDWERDRGDAGSNGKGKEEGEAEEAG